MTGRPRTSTLVLIGLFLGALALYILARPASAPAGTVQQDVNPTPSPGAPAPTVTRSPVPIPSGPSRTASPSRTAGPSRSASPSPPAPPSSSPTQPTPGHGAGKRYMARWRDPSGRQRKQRFDRKRDADQHLAKVATDKQAGAYVDPSAGRITFEAYAELWRTGRTHDMATARRIEREFRLHAYEDPKRR